MIGGAIDPTGDPLASSETVTNAHPFFSVGEDLPVALQGHCMAKDPVSGRVFALGGEADQRLTKRYKSLNQV